MDAGTIEAALKLRDEASQELRKFSGSLNDLKKQAGEIGASFTRLGLVITAAVGVPVVAAVKAAKDFESAFANVVKTVEGFDVDPFGKLNQDAAVFRDQLRQLAAPLATTAVELANIASVGGQFGVAQDELLDFTETVTKLGVAIDGIEAETAAAALAQITNVTQEGEGAFRRYADVLVELGNKGSSTEAVILEFAQRLAGAGKQAGLTGPQIFGVGAAMANVGLNAEAGGTAMSRLLSQMSQAGAEGAAASQKFADFAGRIDASVASGEKFSELFRTNASRALSLFFDGLSEAAKQGENLNLILTDLGVAEVRQRDTTLRLAGAQGELAKQMKLATDAAREGTALNEEFRKKLTTFENQWKSFKAEITDVAIELGGPLLSALRDGLDAMKPMIESAKDLAQAFADADPSTQRLIVLLGLGTGLAGILLIVAGKAVQAAGDIWRLVEALRGLAVAEGVAGGVGALSRSLGGLTDVLAKLKVLIPPGAGLAGLFGVSAAGAFIAASNAIDKQAASTERAVQVSSVMKTAQEALGREVRSYAEAWGVARAAFDTATKSGKALTDEQKALKTALDTTNPFIGDAAAKAAMAQGAQLLFSKSLQETAGAAKTTGDSLKGVSVVLDTTVKGAAVAAPAVRTLVDELKAAQIAVSKLDASQRAQIEAGLKMGMTVEEVGKRTRIAQEVVQLYADQMDRASKSTKDLEKDQKALRDALFGADAIEKARTFVDILGSVKNVSFVDPAKAQEAVTLLEGAIDAVQRLGMAATGTTQEQLDLWQRLLPPLKAVAQNYEDVKEIAESMGKTAVAGIEKVEKATVGLAKETRALDKQIEAVQRRMRDRAATAGLSSEWQDLTKRIDELSDEIAEMEDEADNADPALRAVHDRLIELKRVDAAQEIADMAIQTREFALIIFQLNPQLGATILHLQNVEQASEGTSRGLRDAANEAERARQKMFDFGASVGFAVTDALRAGEGLAGVIKNLGQVVVGQLTESISESLKTGLTDGINNGLKSVSVGASFAQGLGTAGIATIATLWIDQLVKFITDEQSKVINAGRAMAEQFMAGLGGPMQARRTLRQSGVGQDQIDDLFNAASPEEFQDDLQKVMPALNRFKELIDNLGVSMDGINTLGKALGITLTQSMESQDEAAQAAFDAMQKLRKESGATQSELDAAQAAFTEAQKNRTYEATEEQIAQYNRLGTITAGVLANVIGRTGDVVSAVLEMGPALDQLAEAQSKFGLTDQTNAATQAVIDLYTTINDNEDVFTSIAGIGQVMRGFGDSALYSTELANAFGAELSAAFETLTARGVDANLALATMAPQLQQLWELSKNGKIVLDETTKALIDQAETAGIVGEAQKDINKQVLSVLVEIRDMFAESLPVAIVQTRNSVAEVGSEVDRTRQRFPATQKAVEDLGKAAADAATLAGKAAKSAADEAVKSAATATKAQKRVYDEAEKASQELLRQQRIAAEEGERVTLDSWRRINGGIIDSQEKLAEWLREHPLPVDFDVADLQLPDPGTLTVPVEYELPEGRTPWDEMPGPPPSSPGFDDGTFDRTSETFDEAMRDERAAVMPTSQTIVMKVGEQTLTGIVVRNMPEYVELHVGDR